MELRWLHESSSRVSVGSTSNVKAFVEVYCFNLGNITMAVVTHDSGCHQCDQRIDSA